eukprot:gene22033-27338_t
MAGLRNTSAPVEEEGVRRAKAWAAGADLRLWLRDLTRPDVSDPTVEVCRPGDWIIGTKADLAQGTLARMGDLDGGWQTRLNVNCPDDVEMLSARITAHLATVLGGRSFPATTRSRHRLALAAGIEALTRAIDVGRRSPEVFGEDLRLAAR